MVVGYIKAKKIILKNNLWVGIILIFLFTLTLSCISTKEKVTTGGIQPRWITDPMAYDPYNEYLCAVGVGTNLKIAEQSAISDLVKTIKVTLKSSTKFSEDSIYSEAISSLNSDQQRLQEIIETETFVDALVGVKTVKNWTSKDNLVYVLVVLNKQEATTYYSNKLNVNNIAIENNLKVANEYGYTFEGVSSVLKAKAILLENSSFLDILNVVNHSSYQTIFARSKTENELDLLSRKYANNIKLDITVNGDQNQRVATLIANTFSELGFETQVISKNPEVDYWIESNLVFEEVPSKKNFFVRYLFDLSIVDQLTGMVLFSDSSNAREGHLSKQEAQQRAFRRLEKYLTTQFNDKFISFLLEN